MATTPTVTTISTGAKYDATTLNANFEALRDAFSGVVGTDGTSGANNTMTGDLDMAGNTIRNAVLPGTLVGLEFQGTWTTATEYEVNDIIYDSTDNRAYICVTTHTSTGSLPISTNADSAKWGLLLDSVAGAGTVTSVATGDGITGGPITSSGTVAVDLAGDPGLEFNSAQLRVKQGTGILRDSSGVNLDINGLTTENTVDTTNDTIAFYDNNNAVIRKTAIDNILPDSLTAAVAQSATGTAINFTSIPSTVKRITLMFSEVSLDGTDTTLVQLGSSGGYETSGYISSCAIDTNGSTTQGVGSSTAGFLMSTNAATQTVSGIMIIANVTGNTWVEQISAKRATNSFLNGAGSKALSGTLDRLRIVPTGSNSFDAGTINILYE